MTPTHQEPELGPYKDHFSAVAAQYASGRPEYPRTLFEWIASVAPSNGLVWDVGCGSGQASRGLAAHFLNVFASDPSPAQIRQAHAPANVRFVVEAADSCSVADASVDVICAAQALHWFERDAFFKECSRVLVPRGVLVAWVYGDPSWPDDLASALREFRVTISPYWPPESGLFRAGYSETNWPFLGIHVPPNAVVAEWSFERVLNYLSSISASRRHFEATGIDAVREYAASSC